MANNLDVKSSSKYINLLTFTWAAGAVIARYCAGDRPYTDGGGNVFAECPQIKITFGKQSGGIDDVPVTVQMSVIDPVATMLVGYPFSKTSVLIEEIDPTDASTRRKLFWGQVKQCTGNKNGNAALAEIKIAGIKDALTFPLGIPALNTCAWQFGDSNCTVNLAAIQQNAVISHLAGTNVQFSAPIADSKYTRGTILVGGISLLIRNQISTTLINLINIPPPSWLGATALLTPGCLKTAADCKNTWNNLLNFGGFGIGIPIFNPNTETQ